ncbi:hypothetical protein A2U01_0028905, partial [Trifolium medium]|nr:hypothetical protein [Trifolium medium]
DGRHGGRRWSPPETGLGAVEVQPKSSSKRMNMMNMYTRAYHAPPITAV